MKNLGLRDVPKHELVGASLIPEDLAGVVRNAEGRTWEDLNREFHFLWGKHKRSLAGSHAPLNTGLYAADLETMVMNFLSRNGALNSRVFEDDKLRRERMALLVHLWNKDALNVKSVMRRDVKSQEKDKKNIRDANFEWGQLVWQELKMWVDLGHPVDQKEIAWLSDRRGFRPVQRTYLTNMLKALGLYQKVKKEVSHGENVLLDVPGVPRGLGPMVESGPARVHDEPQGSGPLFGGRRQSDRKDTRPRRESRKEHR